MPSRLLLSKNANSLGHTGVDLPCYSRPHLQEFHEETVRKVRQLNKYDCLRANKSTMAWSVEARTPFLDRRFLEKAFSFDPKYKMCRDEETNQPRMEKYLLRKAFDDAENPYLPK